MDFYLNISKYYNHSNYKNDRCRGVSCFYFIEKIPETISWSNGLFKVFVSGKNDNIKCDGQKILMPALKIKKIAFLGYSEYGTIKDEFVLHTATSSIKKELVFKTYQTNSFQGIDDNEINKKSTPVLCLHGSDGQMHNVYGWVVDILYPKKIIQMDLPINLSLHIMSITLTI